MQVKATKAGFYGKRRATGEEFCIKDETELGSWMELVKAPVKAKKAPAKIKK